MPSSGSLTWQELKAACEVVESAAEVSEHRPAVAVLTCSDARLSPARRFGVPEGSLFVVRVAGNLATAESVASLSFAVSQLGVETVVVLGHSHCGAVEAALGPDVDPSLECIVGPIRDSLPTGPACADLSCAVEANVANSLAALQADPGPLGDAIRGGRVALHGAVIDLATSIMTDVVLPDASALSSTTNNPARSITA